MPWEAVAPDDGREMQRVSWVFGVVVAGTVIAFATITDRVPAVGYDVVGVAVVIALAVGIRVNHPSRPLPWWLLTGGLAMMLIGDAMYFVIEAAAEAPSGLTLADAMYVAAYPVLIAGAYLLGRRHGSSGAPLVDASVGALGFVLIVWETVLEDGLRADPDVVTLVTLLYPVLDIVVVGLLLRLVLSDHRRQPAFWGLLAGFAVMAATDFAYAIQVRHATYVGGSDLDLGWLVAYGTVGTVALHPRMRVLSSERGPGEHLGPAGILILGSTLLVAPVLWLRNDVSSSLGVTVNAAITAAIAVLVIVRLALSSRAAERWHVASVATEERYHALFSRSPLGMVQVGPDGVIREANAAAATLVGYRDGELAGIPVGVFAGDPDVASRIAEGLASLTVAGGREAEDVTLRRRDGSTFCAHVTGVPLPGGDGTIVATVEDVTERRAAEAEMRFRAMHDPLTRLPNRTLLADRIRMGLARARRDGGMLGLLFVDLDGFKSVNDAYGHPVGDEVLAETARRLDEVTRTTDSVARLGGDEFVVLAEQVGNLEELERLASRVIVAAAEPHAVGPALIHLSASVGIAVSRGDTEPEELIRSADVAMYEAKRAGRGRFHVVDGARPGAGRSA